MDKEGGQAYSMVLFLILNFICAALYGVVKLVKKEEAGIVVFFVFLPGLGFVIYFLPRFLQQLLFEGNYDRESLVRRLEISRTAEHPDMKSELGVVPVEDAMAVSDDSEKRELILNQLKKDINENYKTLLAAENDSDSESVHYVAAAKMEVYRIQQQKWIESCRVYEEDPQNGENYRAACTSLQNLIEGRILSAREQELYKRKYCKLIEGQERIEKGMVSKGDYETYLLYLVELGQFDVAEGFWDRERDKVRSEKCYMKMMELFYQKREHEKFKKCMEELRQDRQVRLSTQGLSGLRYWMQKE